MSKSSRSTFIFSAPKCTGCGTLTGWRRYTCPQCQAAGLCWHCCDFPVIAPSASSAAASANGGYTSLINAASAPAASAQIKDASVTGWCKSCRYQATDTTRSTVERVGDCSTADVIYIFVHGAGGSRAMFREHAAAITARVPHCGTVLLDLPGHGARHAEPCNALACIDEILRVARNAKAASREQLPEKSVGEVGSGGGDGLQKGPPRLVYVGGSLGGYLGMEAMRLSEFASLFDAAAILGCGQGVGRKDAGVAARVGLVAMGGMVASMGKTGAVRAMVAACKANKHLDSGLVWRTCFTPGMFFDQSDAHVEILRGTDATAGIAAFAQTGGGRRVLFMHGSKDYASNQAALNEAAGACGRSVTVTDGDHFFTHDSRFFDLVMDELGQLATPGEVWGTTA